MKLKKSQKAILAILITVGVILLQVFLTEFQEADTLKRACRRPLEENIVMPLSETRSIHTDVNEWHLEVIPSGVFEVKDAKIHPLARGQGSIVLRHKDREDCQFTSTVSVVSFKSEPKVMTGDVGPGFQ